MCCDPYVPCSVQSYSKPTIDPCSHGWKSMLCGTCTQFPRSRIVVGGKQHKDGVARLAHTIEIDVGRISSHIVSLGPRGNPKSITVHTCSMYNVLYGCYNTMSCVVQ